MTPVVRIKPDQAKVSLHAKRELFEHAQASTKLVEAARATLSRPTRTARQLSVIWPSRTRRHG